MLLDVCEDATEATNVSKPLNTPGYPNQYPANAWCEWILSAPEGEQVLLVVVSGRTETCCDKLEVRWERGS